MSELQQACRPYSLPFRSKSFETVAFLPSGGKPIMKYYRFNQIAMAVLGALLLIFGTRTLINIAFEEHEPEKPGFEVAGGKHGEKAGEKPAVPAGSELPALLAKGDAAKGESAAAICKACHAFEKGAPSPIGPNLHNVVGRKIASVEGFNYSPALKAKSGRLELRASRRMIQKPDAFAPGTMMAFPGPSGRAAARRRDPVPADQDRQSAAAAGGRRAAPAAAPAGEASEARGRS